jgi:microcystin-dependent protein
MQSSNLPPKIVKPFANAASGSYVNAIPVNSQIPTAPGRASLADGFPPLTFQPLDNGGVPPFGADMNGILKSITAIQQWQTAGGFFPYDSSFSTTIGGYPKGATLIKATNSGLWQSTVENNTTNPDTGGAGWVDFSPVPAGSILMWSTATAPTGYLLCDGSAVSRTTYARLFSAVSTTFGTGDGSTTFNLPNYTNRMPYGTTIGATGGSADAVVVSHTHTAIITDPGHVHNGNSAQYSVIGSVIIGPNTVSADSPSLVYSNLNHASAPTDISITNTATGVSGTDANIPPYLGIQFIIKI